MEALRLAVQAESAPAPVRQVKEDLSGLKVIAKVILDPRQLPDQTHQLKRRRMEH